MILRTLGGSGLLTPAGDPLIGPGKSLVFLVYLHCSPARSANREHLVDVFWANLEAERARHALRQMVYSIRSTLGEEALVARNGDLVLAIPLECDRDRFLEAVEAGDVATAVQLYGGEFVPGFAAPGGAEFEQWADLERARLRAQYLRAVESVVRQALDHGRVRDAHLVARVARERCPNAESAWRMVIETLLAGDNSLQAAAEADSLEAWLDAEALTPDTATMRVLHLARRPATPRAAQEPSPLVAELIGREGQFAQALEAWHAVRSGQARHVHLVSGPGGGKTRLLLDLSARLRDLTPGVAFVRALPGERSVSYTLAADLAEALASLSGAKAVSPSSAGELVALAPALSAVYASTTPPRRPPSEVARLRLAALRDLLKAVADEGPVVLVVDDVHWADPASLDLLRGLISRLPPRILVLTAARPQLANGLMTERTQELVLPPLSNTQVLALLTSIGGFADPVDARRLTDGLHRVTRGVPLLVLEGLRLALDGGTLRLGPEGWRWEDLEAALHDMGRDHVLASRLEALDPDAHWLLLVLATAGTPLATDELDRTLREPARLADLLFTLEQRNLVRRAGTSWELAHDEIADIALAAGSDERRQSAHAVLARVLSDTPEQDLAVLRRVGRHWAEAGAATEHRGVWRRFVRASRIAGDQRRSLDLAMDFLGFEAREARAPAKRLVAALPLYWRAGLWSTGRIATAGLAAAAVLATVVISALPGVAQPQPDAELVLLERAGDSAMVLRTFPVRAASWQPGSLLQPAGLDTRVPLDPERTLFVTDAYRDRRVHLLVTAETDNVTTMDVFLVGPRTTMRLTAEPRDDLRATFSPDRRSVVFQTARWTPPGDDDSDLAVKDLVTGLVRQLTSGPDTDRDPIWSPHGTRIGFVRRFQEGGGTAACWVTADGTRSRCVPVPAHDVVGLAGWTGTATVLALAETRLGTALLTINVDDGTWGRSYPGIASFARVSPDGRWVACRCADEPGAGFELVVWPVADPEARRTVPSSAFLVAWAGPATGPALDSLRFEPDHLPLPLDGTLRPRFTALSTTGMRLTIPASVITWSTEDTAVVRIQPETGETVPVREGQATIRASAGGWREATFRVAVVPPAWNPVLDERWESPDTTATWRFFGEPRPVVTTGPDGVRGLHNNGDGSYHSGAWAVPDLDAIAGAGVETLISVPVSRDKWQVQSIILQTVRSANFESWDRTTGGLPPTRYSLETCGISYPSGEGIRAAETITAWTGEETARFAAGPGLRAGGWTRVRLQLFSDGTCGVAVDGTPLWRSRARVPVDHRHRVVLTGNSAGSRVMVGPVTAWEGVRGDLNWAALGGEGPMSGDQGLAATPPPPPPAPTGLRAGH